jgi:hypothetical protein
VTDSAEANKVLAKLPLKYADAPAASPPLQMPTADRVALFRVEPEMISVLDYSEGFGRTDLVARSVEAAPTAR